MRYALMVREDETAEVGALERSRRVEASRRVEQELRDRGVLMATERLHGTDSTTSVRAWHGGDVFIASGPVEATCEQVCSLLFVECKDLDEAIEIATRVPAAWHGTVEIRPVLEDS
jgi:hypothetical protein